MIKKAARIVSGLTLIFAFSSCSTVIGTVRPIDEKSSRYSVEDLSQDPRSWRKLPPESTISADNPYRENKEAFSSEVSDLVFQSLKTSAIVSLNSACRGEDAPKALDLKRLSDELLLGFTDVRNRQEDETSVNGYRAYHTKLEGTLSGARTRIEAFVVEKPPCTYDLMYIASPRQYPVHEADFTRFVSSLRLR